MKFVAKATVIILIFINCNHSSADAVNYKFPLYKIGIKVNKPINYYLLTKEKVNEYKNEMMNSISICYESKFAIEYYLNNPNFQILINENNFNNNIAFIKYPKTKGIKDIIDNIQKNIIDNCYSYKDSRIELLNMNSGATGIGSYHSFLNKITISDITYYSEAFIIETKTSVITISINNSVMESNTSFIEGFEYIYDDVYDNFINEASNAISNSNIDKALLELKNAIDAYPQNITAYENRSIINLSLKKYHEVINDANLILNIDSSNINGYILKGLAFYHQKKPKESIHLFTSAKLIYLLLNTLNSANEYLFSFADIYSFIGEAYMELNDSQNAINYLNLALEASIDSLHTGTILFNLGIVHSIMLNNPIRAVDYYSLAINSYPIGAHTQRAEAFYNRGLNKRYVDDYKGAISDYDLAIVILPNYIKAYNNRGFAKITTGDYVGAIYDFTYIIDNSYENTETTRVAMGNRGIAKIALGLDGCSDLKKAIDLGSQNVIKFFNEYCK